MQVGVCTFHAAPAGFVARPFQLARPPVEDADTMYSDTAAFHVDNHMDFTKWYTGGVPFMTEAGHARQGARRRARRRGAGGRVAAAAAHATRASDKVLVDGAMERVRAWEAAAAAGSGDAAELELPPCNSFLRAPASVSRPNSPSSPSRAARSRGATATAARRDAAERHPRPRGRARAPRG